MAVSIPDCNIAGRYAFTDVSVGGGEDAFGEVHFLQSTQKVQAPRRSFCKGTGVDGPGEVLREENA